MTGAAELTEITIKRFLCRPIPAKAPFSTHNQNVLNTLSATYLQ